MTFEEKVRSMKPSEIVQAMVDGLRHPAVEVNMYTFGRVGEFGVRCFGCAATNAICKIAGITLTEENVGNLRKRAEAVNANCKFLHTFENAIDNLRGGEINDCNFYLLRNKITPLPLPPPTSKLPWLEQDDYLEGLPEYEEYATYLRSLEADEKAEDPERWDFFS